MTKPTGRPRGRPRKHPRPEESAPTSTATLEEQEAALGREIEAMERELEETSSPLSWAEINKGALEELEAQERRRGLLPRLLTAARIKRAELAIAREQRRADSVKEERREAHEALEAATAKRWEAVEEENMARVRWSAAHTTIEKAQRRIKDRRREISQLKGEV